MIYKSYFNFKFSFNKEIFINMLLLYFKIREFKSENKFAACY